MGERREQRTHHGADLDDCAERLRAAAVRDGQRPRPGGRLRRQRQLPAPARVGLPVRHRRAVQRELDSAPRFAATPHGDGDVLLQHCAVQEHAVERERAAAAGGRRGKQQQQQRAEKRRRGAALREHRSAAMTSAAARPGGTAGWRGRSICYCTVVSSTSR